MNEAKYSVQVVTTEEALEGLRSRWAELLGHSSSSTVFSEFDWLWNWWKHFGATQSTGKKIQLHILQVSRQGQTVGVVPLVIRVASRGSLSIRKLEFLGSSFNGHNDLLLPEDSSGQATAVIAYLQARQHLWDVVELRHICSTSPSVEALRKSLQTSDLPHRIRRDSPSHFVPLDSDWQGYTRHLTRESRATFHKKANRLKRLEAEGLHIRVVERPDEEIHFLDQIVRLEQIKKARVGPTLHIFPEAEAFFHDLTMAFGPRGQIWFALIEMRERLIAYNILLRRGNVFSEYAKAFDPAFAYYSPGTMLVPRIIDHGFRSGCTGFDMLRGSLKAKALWPGELRESFRIEIWNRRWRSRSAAALYFRVRPPVLRQVSHLARARGSAYTPDWEI